MIKKVKNQNVLKEDWDVLIILDACRFDYFKKVYLKEFKQKLNGTLERRKSLGSSTPEWLSKTFIDYYDIDYYSANPYVNSIGYEIDKLTGDETNFNWCSVDHFKNIIDVWNFGFNNSYGTVLPETFRELSKNLNSSKKILHLIQPHIPFIHPDVKKLSKKHSWGNIPNKKEEEKKYTFKYRMTTFLFNTILDKFIKSNITRFRIRDIFNTPSKVYYELAYRQLGIKGIKLYYQSAVYRVLRNVVNMIKYLDGNIVITSDHGECLGEHNIFGHPSFKEYDELKIIPWLVIKNG